ncbi:transglutaminaseTgpA domain-containing protein [Actinomadura algeriensis]|uniref:Transglutaminase-like putative cysteine protease n=1 Tax=Actinomadura algeriensis TaxID=1679523 RepID=A0ABR9JR42_9ACTN|nr:transglutaminase domain-containing protein [Actinomadura algeriensis]MBE1532861.1 transglutaminase-like putative cysteine protease [Actinomadura algeriensis]
MNTARGRRARAALSAAAVALAAAASAPLLAAGYGEPSPVVAVLACTAALAVAVTAAAHRLPRAAGPAAIPVGLPVAAIWLVVLASRAPGPVQGAVPGAVDAVLHSGARILTTAPGAAATVDLLAFPVLAVWLAGAIATVLCRDGRVLPALVPGTVLLCGAAALNPQAAGPGCRSAALLVGAATVLLAAAPRGRPDAGRAGLTVRMLGPEPVPEPRRARVRALAAAAALVCAVPLSGVGAAVAAPGVLEGLPVRAGDPRRAAEAPEVPRAVRNPLSYLSAWAADPDVPLMDVSGPPTSLRWVTLAEFTGPVWLPDSTYRPSGPVLRPAEEAPPGSVRTAVRVSVRNLPGDWVPAPGVPTRVDGIAVGHDETSGTLLSSDGPVAGRAYTATGAVPDWSGPRASPAAPASGGGYERYLRLPPGAPPRLAEIAVAAAGDGDDHRRASRLAEYLRESYTFEPGAPGGHGYAELAELLVPPGRRGGGATSEQFASAFAVLARAVGLPSRVVVGFGQGEGDGDGRVVRTGDAVAWGEIHFEGLGWVPYDPNPKRRSTASPRPRPGERTGVGGTHDDGAARTAGSGGGSGLPRHGGHPLLPVVPLVLLLLFVVGVPLLRLSRLRRLRRGSPSDRILAMWTEVLVAMRLAGLPVPVSATTAEVTARLAREVPRTDPGTLRRLGALVNAAGFGGTVTPADAAVADAQARSLIAELRRSRSLPRRLVWWWDPRALPRAAHPIRSTRWVHTGSAGDTRSTSVTATTVRQ